MNSSSLSKSLGFFTIAVLLSSVAFVFVLPSASTTTNVVLGAALLFNLLGLAMLWKVRRVLHHMLDVARKQIAGDLEARNVVGMDRGDLGELLAHVNYSTDKLDSFIREIQASTHALAQQKYYRRVMTAGLEGAFLNYAAQINQAIAEVQKTIQQFSAQTDSFEDLTRNVLTTLDRTGQQMNSSAEQMGETTDITLRRVSEVASFSEETSVNVQTVSAAVEELSASSTEIGNQVQLSSQVTEQAVNDVRLSETKISSLSDAAETIGQVVGLISSIAEQTHMLALNATIEAARAGESGKGFAVVAGEVKDLASQTSNAIEQISSQVGAIQGATAEAVEVFRKVSDSIIQVGELTQAISVSASQQAIATSEIAQNVTDAHFGSRQVAGNVSDVSSFAQDTGEAAVQVRNSVTEFNENVQDLANAITTYIADLRTGPLRSKEAIVCDG